MMFLGTWQAVLDGSKTQTRRLVKDSEYYMLGKRHANRVAKISPEGNQRAKWIVGNTYAVQPGRGKKSVGRILLREIRKEGLQDISPKDIIAEGFCDETGQQADIVAFMNTWDSIHIKSGARWEDDPAVFVLSFCLVERNG